MNRNSCALFALGLAVLLAGCESAAGIGGDLGKVVGAVTQGMAGGTAADFRGATTDIEEAEEIELGRAVTAALGSRYKLLRDPALTRYVALVGNTVAQHSARPDLRYYFGVLDTEEVNAFAAPGGYVFITRGTLALMRDEAALAGVLGHEIGHIALRHHIETIKDEKRAALTKGVGTTALQLGSGFIPGVGGSVTSTVVNSPLMNLMADGAVNLALKGFSRKEESEADGVGVQYASRAGYHPAGMRDFLKAVQDSGSRPAKSGFLVKFTSTHPGADDRLKEREAHLKNAPAGGRRAVARFEQALAGKF